MTVPVIASRTLFTQSSGAGVVTISLGTLSAGDLLVVVANIEGISTRIVAIDETYSGKRWTLVKGSSVGVGGAPSYVAWKVAEGGDQLRLLANGTPRSVCQTFKVTGHGSTVYVASAHNIGTNGDPPNASITGSAQDVLAIAALCCGSRLTVSAGPSGYSNFDSQFVGVLSSGVTTAIADRSITSMTSEDPGTFTHASTNWCGFTILIPETNITTYARVTQVPVEVLSSNSAAPANGNKYRQIQIAC